MECRKERNKILVKINGYDFNCYTNSLAYKAEDETVTVEITPINAKNKSGETTARNFRKLNEYTQTVEGIDIKCINSGAWCESTTLLFDASGNRNAGIVSKGNIVSKIKEVEVVSVDSVLDGEGVDYIKYDVEGSEKEALSGSAETIRKHSPMLLVSLYHRSEDMFVLPELVKSLNQDYSLYLRRFAYVPAWDLNLYAIKK